MALPQPQTPISTRAGFDQTGLLSHCGAVSVTWRCSRCSSPFAPSSSGCKAAFTTPCLPLKIQSQRIAASLATLVEGRRHSTKMHSGFWRDLAVRKRKSEVESQLGPVQEIARRHGLTTPIVDELCRLIADIEAGRRQIDITLAEALRAVALKSPSAAT